MNYNKFIIALLLICTGLQIMQSSDYIPLGDKLHVPLSETQSAEDRQKKNLENFRETSSSPFAELSPEDKNMILNEARKTAKEEYIGTELSNKKQIKLEIIKELAIQPGTIAEAFYNTMQEERLKYQTNSDYIPLKERLS